MAFGKIRNSFSNEFDENRNNLQIYLETIHTNYDNYHNEDNEIDNKNIDNDKSNHNNTNNIENSFMTKIEYKVDTSLNFSEPKIENFENKKEILFNGNSNLNNNNYFPINFEGKNIYNYNYNNKNYNNNYNNNYSNKYYDNYIKNNKIIPQNSNIYIDNNNNNNNINNSNEIDKIRQLTYDLDKNLNKNININTDNNNNFIYYKTKSPYINLNSINENYLDINKNSTSIIPNSNEIDYNNNKSNNLNEDIKKDNLNDLFENLHLNLLDKKISDNKFSFFNQVHKHMNIEKTKSENSNSLNYIRESEIKIINFSKMDIYLELSNGNNNDNSKIKLNQNEEKIFNRSEKSIYKISISNSPNNLGYVFNIKSGCIYHIDKGFNLISPSGEYVSSSILKFDENFEMKNQFGLYIKNQENNIEKEKNSNKIIILNKGGENISIKIQGDSKDNFEDIINVEPLIYIIFKRKPGDYIATIYKKKKNFNIILSTNQIYDINNIENEIEVKTNMNFLSKINFNKKFSNSLLNKNYNNNNNIDKITQNEPSEQWQEFFRFLKSFKKNVKDFTSLLFSFISIKNNSFNETYVRIKSRKIGSEEFIRISTFGSFKWKRLSGNYIAEFVNVNLDSKRFILNGDESYTIDKNNNFIKDSNGEIMTEINQKFSNKESDNYLIYYDKLKKEYHKEEIKYNINTCNNNNNNNIINPQDYKEDNKDDDHELEYFEGKKPNYKPGTLFFDVDFPADESCLTAIDKMGNKRLPHFKHKIIKSTELSKNMIKNCKFVRPKDFFENQFYLYKDDINVDDVTQGQLGNCYLMAVISSISQRPDLIRNIFKSKTVNLDGFYELYYYENGKKKIMFIDDFLVVYDSVFMHEFMFAKPNKEELWVSLLEKAYAKYEGGFSNINGGGAMFQELNWFTGCPTRQINTEDPCLWEEILNSCKVRNIITTSSRMGSGSHLKKTENNINNAHAYSVLDAKEFIHNSNQENIKLLKVRNPWGRGEWNGDFSDKSLKWTNELKEFFNYNEADGDNGIFFIPFEYFIEEFRVVIICYLDKKR